MGADATDTWRARVAEQERCGKSIAEYCARHGLSTSSFYRWRRIVSREDRARARFLPVHVVEATPVAEGPTGVEIVLRSGHRVELQRGFDAETLRAAVIALEEGAC